MSTPPPEIEGYERHHRQKGDRKNWSPTNILYLTPEDHRWAEAHPDQARELGWSVSRYEDPEQVPVVIPKTIHREAAPRKMEKKRNRATINFKVPVDKREDGAGLFDDLWEQWLEKLEKMPKEEGSVVTEGDTGKYGALIAALYVAVTSS